LLLTTAGEGLRIAAFYTCRSNFTHLVRFRKVEGHELVTNGVYSIFRHPSYTGYFYFSIGGQILLGNVLSLFAFAFVLTRFFNDRIDYEEKALAKFFPEYLEYRRHTYILIPLVKNPNLDARTPDYDYADSD
jgi:protein-S-isoprenylcysteine O-methyltransferase